MFVLDTNVLSEIMKSRPDPRVAGWVARQSREGLFTTVVCKAEVLSGIAMMPVGRRRRDLEDVARNLFEAGFRGRVLSFEDAATSVFAEISTARRRAGRTISVFDLIIAAITRTEGAAIVTRDFGGFELTGLSIIDPWEENPT